MKKYEIFKMTEATKDECKADIEWRLHRAESRLKGAKISYGKKLAEMRRDVEKFKTQLINL